MSTHLDGYALLASAVIQRALYDLQYGPPRRRKAARAAIHCGALDYWVEKLAPNGRAYHAVCAKLRALAST